MCYTAVEHCFSLSCSSLLNSSFCVDLTLVTQMVMGWIFMGMTQFVHMRADCFDMSHLTPERKAVWSILQVETSHNWCPTSYFWCLASGYQNVQIEHHLFPGVSEEYFRDLSPIIQQVCVKHGVNYKSSDSYSDMLGAHWDWINECSLADA